MVSIPSHPETFYGSGTGRPDRSRKETMFQQHASARRAPSILAVTGANGFIGSHVVTAAREHARDVVRPISRLRRAGVTSADIRERDAITRALDGASMLIHAASYIGNDPEQCETVNVGGTANVLAAARTVGIDRIVYVSTAAVYGRGPFRRLAEGEAPIAPASTLSVSRATAERLVLDAGGAVVRPHLVMGPGDRWVGNGVIALTRAVGGLIEKGSTLQSVIDVMVLAEAIVRLMRAPTAEADVYHATSSPVSVRRLVESLRHAGVDLPVHTVTRASAERAVDGSPGLSAALRLLGVEHTFDGSRLARDCGARVPAFCFSPATIAWYRRSETSP